MLAVNDPNMVAWVQPNITFAMIKSDVINNGVLRDVLNHIRGSGFRIIHSTEERGVYLTEEQINAFYAEHVGRPYFGDLVASVGKGVVPLILEKNSSIWLTNAVPEFRELIGATDARKAAAHTIRAQFGGHKFDEQAPMAQNAIHGSDSRASVLREIAIVFPGLTKIRTPIFGDFWLDDWKTE